MPKSKTFNTWDLSLEIKIYAESIPLEGFV